MNGTAVSIAKAISTPPRPASQALHMALSVAFSALDNDSLTEAALPSGARVGLAARLRALDESLAPASREAILSVLASVSFLPTKTETDPANVKAFLSIEAADLEVSGLPAWSLEAAARAYRLGEVGDGHWRPTAGDLASYARQRVAAHRREREKIGQVLRARLTSPQKSASPEQRQRVAEGLRELSAKLSA